MVLERILESPLDCKEIQSVQPKGNRSWIFIGRTDAEAETPILWPPDVKNWLIWKDSDSGKDWRREEKGTTEDEMVGWHHQLDRHEFEQAPRVGDGQGSLVCCSPWGHKDSDMTEPVNWTELCSIIEFILRDNIKYVSDRLLSAAKLQKTQVKSISTIPGPGRSPGEGNGNPFQYSCLENSMDGEAWWTTVHGVTKSQTWLSDFTFTFIKGFIISVIRYSVAGLVHSEAEWWHLSAPSSSLLSLLCKPLLLGVRQETQVPSLGQEDPLEKGMATWQAVVHGVTKSQTQRSN